MNDSQHSGQTVEIKMEPMNRLGGSFWVDAMPFITLRGSGEVVKKEPPPAVAWEDVIGLEAAKTALREAIEQPYQFAELYKHFNIKPSKGVLLYGPPGCGKTMLGKAAAAAMAKAHGKEYADGFFFFNGADMMGKYVGDESKWVNECFEKAETFYRQNGYPAVLFFDECDSMLRDRKNSPHWIAEGVNTFLTRMDGMKESHAFIILATNNHEVLDEAAIRPGRIDKKIFVGPPDRAAVSSILLSVLRRKPLTIAVEDLAEFATAQLFAESRIIGDRDLHQFLNGAMVVNVAERAAMLAFQKAILAGIKEAAGLGISPLEIREAVDAIQSELKGLSGQGEPKQVKITAETTIRVEGAEGGEP